VGFQQPKDLHERVVRAAEAALEAKGVVSPIDLLINMHLLDPGSVRLWEKGISPHLQVHIQGGPQKLEKSYALFKAWAQENRLVPVLAALRGAGRDGPRDLQVTADANPEQEAFFRTHYAAADIDRVLAQWTAASPERHG
jgi:hypothetical protein